MYALEERICDLLGPGKGSGVNQMFRCVFHEERHASLSVNMSEGVYYCFACGAKGNYEGLCRAFGEVVDDEYRWERAKRSIEQGFVHVQGLSPDILEVSAEDKGRSGYGNHLKSFCHKRSISRESVVAFGVREVREGRLAFPYMDIDSERILGIKYRHPDGSKTAESGSSFHKPFGIGHAVGKPDVFIFEGESDTLLGQTLLGAYHGVGVCGTSGVGVSEAQWVSNGLHFLFARRIFLSYDADSPGDKCAETGMRVLGDERCIRLRPKMGKDWCDAIANGESITDAARDASVSSRVL